MIPVGFAVAGGHSRRMGEDKAALPWKSGTLLDHALDRLRTFCPRVRILSGAVPRYADRGVPVLLDERQDCGPLAGLETALASLGEGEVAVLLAVDLPLVPAELLEGLVARIGDGDAVIPRTERGLEPLAAVYAPACLPVLRERLAAGERQMTSFHASVRVQVVGPYPAHAFRNLNTRADYEELRKIEGWG